MVENIKKLLPYTSVTKTWLLNLSVGALAIGLFQDNWLGIPAGLLCFLLALCLVYLEERYLK